MISLLLIMMVLLSNGLGNTEQKDKHSATMLREEDLKTKAWLLMVESGKVDDEELRRITPKSIFIAPLLSSRDDQCQEGYRHNHLGQCVKIIKIDPKVQLELLLKRLNKLYTEKQQEEKRLPEVSNEPLHFSLSVSTNDEYKEKVSMEKMQTDQFVAGDKSNVNNGSVTFDKPEIIPLPLPMVLLNQTNQANVTDETKDIESPSEKVQSSSMLSENTMVEGSGFGLVDSIEQPTDVTLLSDSEDYIDTVELASTTKIYPATETTTEIPTETLAPFNSNNDTKSYHTINNSSSLNSSIVSLPNKNRHQTESLRNSSSDIIVFPNDDIKKTQVNLPVDRSKIWFPDSNLPNSGYRSTVPPKAWDPQRIYPSGLPSQQFWWLPENWKVDGGQKSTLIKFWSRLPLIQDIRFPDDSPPKNHKLPHLSHSFISPRSNRETSIVFNQPHTVKSNKPFIGGHFREFIMPQHPNFRIQR